MKYYPDSFSNEGCGGSDKPCQNDFFDENEDIPQNKFVPELDEDYLEAERRAQEHYKMMEDATTIFEEVYWRILFRDVGTFITTWSGWLKGKLLILGVELLACSFAAAAFLAIFSVALSTFGPFRLRTLLFTILALIIGSTFALDSVQLAASTVIGTTLFLSVFFTKIANCRVIKTQMKKDHSSMAVIVAFNFWYVGNQVLWVDLSEGVLGLQRMFN